MNMQDVKELKAEIRKAVRGKRIRLEADEIAESSKQVCGKVCALEAFKNAGLLLSYMPAKNELDVSYITERAGAMGKRVAFPLCAEGGELKLLIPDGSDCFVKGSYGILEPDAERSKEVEASEIDLIIVPAIAFTKEGMRLGQGKGYYDRLLKRTDAETIGVGYDFQLFETLPAEPHDRSLNCVITPSSMFFCGNSIK